MKKALFYAGVIGYGCPSIGRIMVVTSVKGAQLYGRDFQHGNPTHRSVSDMTHAFRTEDEARDAVAVAQDAYNRHNALVAQAKKLLADATRAQYDAVDKAVGERSMDFAGIMSHLREQGVEPGPGTADRMQRRMRK